jgi:hypothetical protein
MDLTVPFYKFMGLEIVQVEKFVATVRYLIGELRTESPEGKRQSAFTKRSLHYIEREMGAETRQRLTHWIQFVFEDIPSDYPHTNAWASILTWCSAKPEQWECLGLPAQKSRLLLLEYRETMWDKDVLRLREEEKEEPMSEWDAYIYTEQQFDDDCMDPFLWIINTVNKYRFQCALKSLVDRLSDSEISVLTQKAQEIGAQYGLTGITELQNPKGLHEQARGY